MLFQPPAGAYRTAQSGPLATSWSHRIQGSAEQQQGLPRTAGILGGRPDLSGSQCLAYEQHHFPFGEFSTHQVYWYLARHMPSPEQHFASVDLERALLFPFGHAPLYEII